MTVAIYLAADSTVPPSMLSDADLAAAAPAMQDWINGPGGPGPAYSQGRYIVKSVPRGQAPPAPGPRTWPVHFVADDQGAPGAAGYHDIDPHGDPYAKILLRPILQAGMDWFAVTSHEVCEMIVDRTTRQLVLGTWGSQQVAYMQESCDPVERFGYTHTYHGRAWRVSDFVLPAYWLAEAPGPYSRLGNAPAPLTPHPTGRQDLFTISGSREVNGAPTDADGRGVSALLYLPTPSRNTPAGT